MENLFEVGEVVGLECLPEDARVVQADGKYLYVKWPWGSIDPDSNYKWDGLRAFPVDPQSFEWTNTPWRLEPAPNELSPGDVCMIGIPYSRVLVRGVRRFDPPRDCGSLPRPSSALSVVPLGEFQDDEEAGYLVYLDGAEPVNVLPVLRK